MVNTSFDISSTIRDFAVPKLWVMWHIEDCEPPVQDIETMESQRV